MRGLISVPVPQPEREESLHCANKQSRCKKPDNAQESMQQTKLHPVLAPRSQGVPVSCTSCEHMKGAVCGIYEAKHDVATLTN